MILSELESDDPIRLNVYSEEFKLIYDYMKHIKLSKPNIDLIEKPANRSISEYFSDNWYINFFPTNLKKCQILYNTADYLGMSDLCKIILGHIGYSLNKLENREDVKDEILLPEQSEVNNVCYNINSDKFEKMTKEEITKYVKEQSEKWKICI
jgi:hypothetical protein